MVYGAVVAEQTDVPPSRWLGIWVRDQAFWRDVASRTLAGLIVVGFTVLAGSAVGLIRLPQVATALAGLLCAGVFSAVQAWIFSGPRYTGRPRAETKRLRWVLFAVTFAFWTALMVGVYLWGVQLGRELRGSCDAGVVEDCL